MIKGRGRPLFLFGRSRENIFDFFWRQFLRMVRAEPFLSLYGDPRHVCLMRPLVPLRVSESVVEQLG